MKGIVLYKSKYGATRQYARWIGDELNLPVLETDAVQPAKLASCDTVVLGSSVYIGKLLIRRWLKVNAHALAGKTIILFVVCGTPAHKRAELERTIRASLPLELLESSRVFFLPGKLVVKDLSWMDRFMLKMGAKLTKDPDAKKGMLTDYDDVKKEQLADLLAATPQETLERF
jgi:menaquinone-dependent protoporphyrinogen IX oxidase